MKKRKKYKTPTIRSEKIEVCSFGCYQGGSHNPLANSDSIFLFGCCCKDPIIT